MSSAERVAFEQVTKRYPGSGKGHPGAVEDLSLEVPAGAPEGESQKIPVWVRGCKTYVLRWTVETTCTWESCCQDVRIEDCPDLVHHWYDHFYCDRGCIHHR